MVVARPRSGLSIPPGYGDAGALNRAGLLPQAAWPSHCTNCMECIQRDHPPATPSWWAGDYTLGVHYLGLTLVGLNASGIVGYILGATLCLLFVLLLSGLSVPRSETGGWTESNIVSVVCWFVATGGIVGACQALALPGRPQWGRWWALASGWAGACLLLSTSRGASPHGGGSPRGVYGNRAVGPRRWPR